MRMEGVHEAREVVNQLMAGPVSSDFYLLQQDGKAIAGNMPAMPRADRHAEYSRLGRHRQS